MKDELFSSILICTLIFSVIAVGGMYYAYTIDCTKVNEVGSCSFIKNILIILNVILPFAGVLLGYLHYKLSQMTLFPNGSTR